MARLDETNQAGTRDRYSYGFDPSQMSSGNFSLRFKNVGTQAHEMSLFKAPYGVPIEQVQKTNNPTGERG